MTESNYAKLEDGWADSSLRSILEDKPSYKELADMFIELLDLRYSDLAVACARQNLPDYSLHFHREGLAPIPLSSSEKKVIHSPD